MAIHKCSTTQPGRNHWIDLIRTLREDYLTHQSDPNIIGKKIRNGPTEIWNLRNYYRRD